MFRLVTCDTIEEKIYRRQIFKKSIIMQNNGENEDPFRHFGYDQIRDLFERPNNPEVSQTQEKVLSHVPIRLPSEDCDREIISKLSRFEKLHAGIHNHDLIFDAGEL